MSEPLQHRCLERPNAPFGRKGFDLDLPDFSLGRPTMLLRYGYGRGALSLYVIGMALATIVAVIMATGTMRHDIEMV